MGGKTHERPFWQHEPCPPWCTRRHQATDHPDDRTHFSDWEASMLLGLMEPDFVQGEKEVHVYEPELKVFLEQGWREVEPQVHAQVNERDTLKLTVAEARALGETLSKAADLAEGHWDG